MQQNNCLSYSENDLVLFLKRKDKAVFEYLYNNYSAALFGVINEIVRDHHTSEDVLQDTYVKIWERIDQYQVERGRIFTWMRRIAANAAIDMLRSKGEIMKHKCSADDSLEGLHTSINKHPDTIGLSGLIGKLKNDQQQLVKMIYFEGYTINEASKVLSIPTGTIKTKMRRSLSLLRQCYHYSAVI